MRISFVESMRGALTDVNGGSHPVEFEIVAEADGRAFLGNGRTEVAGLVRAAPWAVEASVRGTLHIEPRTPRLAYHLTFRNGADEYVLKGEKHPDWRHPIETMTRLPLTLEMGERVIARGEVAFDLRDLPAFIASWLRMGDARRRLDVRRRVVEREVLDAV